MGVIEIENMEFFSYHGCFKEEQIVGNKFLVDLKIITDCTKASLSDNVDDALDYSVAYSIVKEEMKQKSRLLEHVAKRILDSLYMRFPDIIEASVKVSKMNPPMGGRMEKVSVTLNR